MDSVTCCGSSSRRWRLQLWLAASPAEVRVAPLSVFGHAGAILFYAGLASPPLCFIARRVTIESSAAWREIWGKVRQLRREVDRLDSGAGGDGVADDAFRHDADYRARHQRDRRRRDLSLVCALHRRAWRLHDRQQYQFKRRLSARLQQETAALLGCSAYQSFWPGRRRARRSAAFWRRRKSSWAAARLGLSRGREAPVIRRMLLSGADSGRLSSRLFTFARLANA